jgi:hypothetical protein
MGGGFIIINADGYFYGTVGNRIDKGTVVRNPYRLSLIDQGNLPTKVPIHIDMVGRLIE